MMGKKRSWTCPMVTVLAWSVLEYGDNMTAAKQLDLCLMGSSGSKISSTRHILQTICFTTAQQQGMMHSLGGLKFRSGQPLFGDMLLLGTCGEGAGEHQAWRCSRWSRRRSQRHWPRSTEPRTGPCQ